MTNDLCYLKAKELKLEAWESDVEAGAADENAVHHALASLKKQPVASFLKKMADGLASTIGEHPQLLI